MFRTYRTVYSVTEIVAFKNLPVSTWVRDEVHSPDANFLYDQPTLSRMTDAYIYLLKSVLEPRTIRSVVRYLDHSDTQCSSTHYTITILDNLYEEWLNFKYNNYSTINNLNNKINFKNGIATR